MKNSENTTEKNEEKRTHYDAFISYRHVELDSFVAERLHKMLERYHIPAKIQKRTGKKRIDRVFRDKEELPLSANLGDNIRCALEHSDFLVVLCSPESIRSRWVQNEIEIFLKYHSLEQVLAVLVRGEPEEAFPEKLCYKEEKVVLNTGEEGVIRIPVEPLAADVRGETRKEVKKKLRNEFLRLVAPMISCTYDELKQRRQEYRFKQLAAASIVLAATLAVFLGLSIVSYRQYQNAKINQARYMTEISDQLLSEGNQAEALQSLLSVQPENDVSEPVISEQIYALNNALYSYQYTNQLSFEKNAYFELDSQTEEDSSEMEQKFSPGGKYYLTIDSNGTAYFLDGDKGNCKWKVKPADLDETTYFGGDFYWGSPVGDEKAVLISYEEVFIVDVAGKKAEKIISLPEEFNGDSMECCTANEQYIVITSDEELYVYSLTDEKWEESKGFGEFSEEDVSQIVMTEDDDKLIISFYSSSLDVKGGIFVYSIQEGKFTRLTKTAAKAIASVGNDRLIALQDDGNEFYVACYDLKKMKKVWKVKDLKQRNLNYGKPAGIFIGNLKIQERYDITDTENQYTYRLRSKNLTVASVYLGQYLYCFDSDTGELLRTQDYPGNIVGVSKFDDKTLLVSLSSGEIYAHRIGWEADESGEDNYSYLDTENGSNENYEFLHKIGDVGTDVNSFAYNAEERTIVHEENGTHRVYYSSMNEDSNMEDLVVEENDVTARYFKTDEEVFRCIMYTTDDSKHGIRIYKTGSSEILYQTELEEGWDFEDASMEIGIREDKPVFCFMEEKNNESIEKSGWTYRFYMADLTTGELLGKSEFSNPDFEMSSMVYLDSMKTVLVEKSSGDYCTVDISEYKWGNIEKCEELEGYYYVFLIDDVTIGAIGEETEGSYEESNLKFYQKLSVWKIEKGKWERIENFREEKKDTDDITILNSFGEYDSYVLTGNKSSYVLTGNKEKLLAVHHDDEIEIINWDQGTVVSEISVESAASDSMNAGFLNDDKQLVILYPEEGQLEVWDIETEKLLMQEQIDAEELELVLDSNGKYFGIKADPGLSDSIYESINLQEEDGKNLMIYFIEEDGNVYHYADVPYGYASFEAGEILSIPDNYSGTCRYTAMYSFEDLCGKANKILNGN